jgi:hypothetical protein
MIGRMAVALFAERIEAPQRFFRIGDLFLRTAPHAFRPLDKFQIFDAALFTARLLQFVRLFAEHENVLVHVAQGWIRRARETSPRR